MIVKVSAVLAALAAMPSTVLATPCCEPGFTGFKAYNECKQFYQCYYGYVYNLQTCSSGLLFDTNINNCNWAVVVNTCVVESCGNTPSPAAGSAPPPTPGTTPPPTRSPTRPPTRTPTRSPTRSPIRSSTASPTHAPIVQATPPPTPPPVPAPTRPPTPPPTQFPTESPTQAPIPQVTPPPTRPPTRVPTQPPTGTPTRAPIPQATPPPTQAPVQAPTRQPTRTPTRAPTRAPTRSPTAAPIPTPTPGSSGTKNVRTRFILAPSANDITRADLDRHLNRVNQVLSSSNFASDRQIHYVYHSTGTSNEELPNENTGTLLATIEGNEQPNTGYDVLLYLFRNNASPYRRGRAYINLCLFHGKATTGVADVRSDTVVTHELLHTVGADHGAVDCAFNDPLYNKDNLNDGLTTCNKPVVEAKIPTYTCLS